MTKFLHISDIHLGIKRYGLEERTRDFFHAWSDCLQRYAINERVDFVLIGGDLFDRRQIDPQAANHAIIGLEKLKSAGIPVFAIEGNHDQRETGSNFSWLRSLSQWRFLRLLEPVHRDGVVQYQPWDEDRREGGYADCEGVRIFGSRWYGVTTSNVIPQLREAIRPHLRENGYNVMLLHTEVEGQLNRPIPSVSPGKLLQLRDCVQYLALGHIHKNFVIDEWAFNPGSLEATSMDEYREKRGAYLVELRDGKVYAELVSDYRQRPFVFDSFDLSGYSNPEQASQQLQQHLMETCSRNHFECDPLVEMRLEGRVSFKTSLMRLDEVKEQVLSSRPVLDIIFRNETIPIEYAVAADLGSGTNRSERERRVLEDLVSQDVRWRERAVEMAALILEVKHLVLAEESPEMLLKLLERQFPEPGVDEVEVVDEN